MVISIIKSSVLLSIFNSVFLIFKLFILSVFSAVKNI